VTVLNRDLKCLKLWVLKFFFFFSFSHSYHGRPWLSCFHPVHPSVSLQGFPYCLLGFGKIWNKEGSSAFRLNHQVGKVVQTMYTYVSKCKNNKIKGERKKKKEFLNDNNMYLLYVSLLSCFIGGVQ
jgi:hypothetical protein